MNRHLRGAAGLLIATLAASPAVAAPLAKAESAQITGDIDRLSPALSALATDIWNYAEVGFHEQKSAARLQKELKQAGFQVETGVDGIPTAFIASAGKGGPVIALLAEYDALPGLAQAADADRHPIEGQRAGHACGHNLLGSASVGAAIALKKWLERTGTPGTVRLYGTPAEEGGFAKVFLVRDGYFKDVDVTLAWHPGDRNSASQSQMLSVISGKFLFEGLPSHAAAAPERGRSALDGVEIMNVAVNYLREHVPQETRIHYTITNGGDQPNIVPASAESFYYVRHYDPEVVKDIWGRVTKAAEGAALATGTKVSVRLIGGTYSTLPNYTLGRIADRHLRDLGGFTYSPEEQAYAARLKANLPPGGRAGGGPDSVEPFVEGRKGPASTDVGDVSWATPTLQISTATWVEGTSPHSWQAVSASGTSIGNKGLVLAAKTLALTGAELFRSPDEIAAARAEFEAGRGKDFHYTALIGDQPPALDYTDHK
ncbi:amidohydrolase [Sphingomonas fennica]|uniref:Amidohydrolase n=1 Tax=Edaphosphingomonas fennica TaxID=114404 RepID=A0A2T4I745_9SPHN|nr:amidohydrolase [Sphingomonas fennica]PTD26480.1 amidohydrolase [Sphingomonas fennica]